MPINTTESNETTTTIQEDSTTITTITVGKDSSNFEVSNSSIKCEHDYQCGNGECKFKRNYEGVVVSSHCECDIKYATRNDETPCEYKRKSRGVSFLLSFFVGFTGANFFYLADGNGGYIFAGIFILLCFLAPIFMICVSCCDIKYSKECSDCGSACANLLYSIIILWWGVIWIVDVAGALPDGNGVDTAWFMP